MIAAGDLQLFKWQNTSRIYRSELERFIKAHTTRALRNKRPGRPCGHGGRCPPPLLRPVATTAPSVPIPAATTQRSIVVLEDDENVRRFLVFSLMAEGYGVSECASYD